MDSWGHEPSLRSAPGRFLGLPATFHAASCSCGWRSPEATTLVDVARAELTHHLDDARRPVADATMVAPAPVAAPIDEPVVDLVGALLAELTKTS